VVGEDKSGLETVEKFFDLNGISGHTSATVIIAPLSTSVTVRSCIDFELRVQLRAVRLLSLWNQTDVYRKEDDTEGEIEALWRAQ
jgi:hypothetical protein